MIVLGQNVVNIQSERALQIIIIMGKDVQYGHIRRNQRLWKLLHTKWGPCGISIYFNAARSHPSLLGPVRVRSNVRVCKVVKALKVEQMCERNISLSPLLTNLPTSAVLHTTTTTRCHLFLRLDLGKNNLMVCSETAQLHKKTEGTGWFVSKLERSLLQCGARKVFDKSTCMCVSKRMIFARGARCS